jgi:hypothetical protein
MIEVFPKTTAFNRRSGCGDTMGNRAHSARYRIVPGKQGGDMIEFFLNSKCSVRHAHDSTIRAKTMASGHALRNVPCETPSAFTGVGWGGRGARDDGAIVRTAHATTLGHTGKAGT